MTPAVRSLPPSTDVLIVGAGPFGLSMAAQARHLGIDHVVVGEPMRFWRANMPDGMYLRSDCEWHLDPQNVDTIHAFLHDRRLTPADVEPLSRDFYLEYTRWFQARKHIEPWPVTVERLDLDENGTFRASSDCGDTIAARQVVLALGMGYFKHVPHDLPPLPGRVQHTCDFVDFSGVKGQRWLILGGRQSAFEWAALMCEAGARAIHISHRHDSPVFAQSDWSWVSPVVDGMVEDPSWYRNLSSEEKEGVSRRLWSEGRLKLEPWLAARVQRDPIHVWPNTRLTGCRERPDGSLEATLEGLDGSHDLDVDRIILATGYKVDVARVPLLVRGNILPRLDTENGMPVLDPYFQTSVPGLFMTSMCATGAFGPFFGFTVAVRTSARLIGEALAPESAQRALRVNVSVPFESPKA